MDRRLTDFTQRALAAGLGREETAAALRRAGWAEADVAAAVGAFADIDFPVPVPVPRPNVSARETFVYLIFFSALGASAFSIGAMAFTFIDLAFPDPLVDAPWWDGGRASLRWNLSALVVAFPLFLLTFRMINKGVAHEPSRRASSPRKWITYLTLFLAGAVLSGDVVALVYSFLGGELTVRFALKAAVVGFLSGGIFAYFLAEMRRDEEAVE